MSYPNGSDLAAFLVQAKVLASVPGDVSFYDELAEAASEDWESDTGYRPFLAGESSSARNFDPPVETFLDIRGGLLSVDSLTLDGSALVENQDFYLMPLDHAERGIPAMYIEFQSVYIQPFIGQTFPLIQGTRRRSIAITGVWGYCTELPKSVTQAILAKAALAAAAVVRGAGGVLLREKAGPVEFQYSGLQGSQIGQWQAQYDASVARYRKPRVS